MFMGFAPSSFNFARNAGKFGSGFCSFCGRTPMRRFARLMFELKWNGIVIVPGSFESTPWITLNTIAASSAVRVMGPTRSCDHASTIPPYRLTRPTVGRNALKPHGAVGETVEPDVSVPMPNATQPPAVADAGPADEPLDCCEVFHGFFV